MKTAAEFTEQVRAIADEFGLRKLPEYFVHGSRLVIYVASIREYMVIEEEGRVWWTNDLPLVVPEVLTEQARAIRAEKLSKCKGAGRCFPWCTAKRGKRSHAQGMVQEVVDTE